LQIIRYPANKLERMGFSLHNYHIAPDDFEERLRDGELVEAMIVDVREGYEWDYYHLDEAVHMPMNSIPERLEDLPRDRTVYVICGHGVRSVMVCNYLLDQGFERVTNVQGGMAAVAELRGFAYD
jgi:rhodanese-related sulfurtransferase